jgi:hypothetical protein
LGGLEEGKSSGMSGITKGAEWQPLQSWIFLPSMSPPSGGSLMSMYLAVEIQSPILDAAATFNAAAFAASVLQCQRMTGNCHE